MRFVRLLGKFLISVGVGILLFVLWTLYGTGIYTHGQQRALESNWEKQPTLAIGTGTNAKPHGPGKGYKPAPGTPVFRLRIPSIKLKKMVVEGVDVEDLRKGPGHYPMCRSGFPQDLCTRFREVWPGERGRVIVSGHRTTYGAPFWDLDKLERGDVIMTDTKWGDYRYRVTRKEVVAPDTQAIVIQEQEISELVLTTCNPKFSASQRLIVFAELEPVT